MLAIWFLAFGYAFGSAGERHAPADVAVGRPLRRWPARFCSPRACVARVDCRPGSTIRAFVPEFVLEGYVAVDPSYRLIHDALARQVARGRGVLRAPARVTA